LDQGVVGRQPAAVEVLSRYRRALEQKRELLRQGTDGLEAWNELLAEAAAQLIGRRADFVAALASSLESIVSQSQVDLPPVELRYLPSPAVGVATGHDLLQVLESKAVREREERRILVGPHLDKLEISWAGVDISRIASAGEKKLVGILLCAARGQVLSEVGRKPIILLDDVDAELDRERLLAAWKLFDSAPQIVATTCHTSVPNVLSEARVWQLESGSIKDA
jgi:DNA replication and repair protein RecF